MSDVPKEQYATVIREMIRHEDDVTNHRIMWLLIVQGLMANAYFIAVGKGTGGVLMLSLPGILVALSTFVILYKSYQARGYLHFLGNEAKQGQLEEEYLPLAGWPKKRMKGGWRDGWVCPWLVQAGDVLEPWVFLPAIFIFMWLFLLLAQSIMLDAGIALGLAAILAAVIVSVSCIVWVWSQGKEDK